MSKSSSSSSSSSGIGFFGLLTIVFIVLKLTHFIDWSWCLVLLPLYGPVSILIILSLVAALVAAALDFFRK